MLFVYILNNENLTFKMFVFVLFKRNYKCRTNCNTIENIRDPPLLYTRRPFQLRTRRYRLEVIKAQQRKRLVVQYVYNCHTVETKVYEYLPKNYHTS